MEPFRFRNRELSDMKVVKFLPVIVYHSVRVCSVVYSWLSERFIQYYTIGLCKVRGVHFDPYRTYFYGMPSLDIAKESNVKIGSNFICRSSSKGGAIDNHSGSIICVKPKATLDIGANTGISNTSIYCKSGIKIGDYVNIGAGTLIMDTDSHSLNWHDRHNGAGINEAITKPIVIEDYVFIGANSIILKGVTIGKYSVVGAGSVVSHSIPEGELWAGNPARKIRTIEE